jgi:branched-chain amino acid aminotransferase
VKNDVLYTPHPDACLPGITRGRVIEMARELSIEVIEKNLSLTEFYAADEVFATGTMGELTPVFEIDGRKINRNTRESMRLELSRTFKSSISDLCEKL